MILRLSLALLVGIPAAMAYPWQSPSDRWLLGVATGLIVVLFAWWRGHFVTTWLARRVALWRRRRNTPAHPTNHQHHSALTTITVQINPAAHDELPVNLITSYLDRYDIHLDKIRITTRDRDSKRTTWISLTLSAADNITALTARSPQIPLHDTAELVARRLANHLRETGWEIDPATPTGPLTTEHTTETWHAVRDKHGCLAAYRITVDARITETLQAVWAYDSAEVWTALEFTGSRDRPHLVVVCALRTAARPAATAPLQGLIPENGLHGTMLAALSPRSDVRLPGRAVPVTPHELAGSLRTWTTPKHQAVHT